MRFTPPLLPARFLRRYQRFLAEVDLGDGTVLTVHCPNPGRMTSSIGPGWPARVSRSDNHRRRLAHTLEMTHNGRCWIGVNPMRANRVVREAIEVGHLPELAGYPEVRSEVRYGEGCRADLALADGARRCLVEVKSVTLLDEAGRYAFPDAVTARGRRHLEELARAAAGGLRAVNLFLVLRSDGSVVVPADAVDPAYGAALRRAAARGVEVLAYRAAVTPDGITLADRLAVEL